MYTMLLAFIFFLPINDFGNLKIRFFLEETNFVELGIPEKGVLIPQGHTFRLSRQAAQLSFRP
jgi:hypothetical protein